MRETELIEYAATLTKRKSCCCVFSLQTGVLMLCGIDVLVFAMLCCITGMTVESFEEISLGTTGMGFTLATDGICILLFFIRLLYAFWYVRVVTFPPKMDY